MNLLAASDRSIKNYNKAYLNAVTEGIPVEFKEGENFNHPHLFWEPAT
jgi:hypothetical protein